MKRVRFALTLLLMLTLVACGESKKVGKDVDLDALNAKANRIGALKTDKGTGGKVGEKEQVEAAKSDDDVGGTSNEPTEEQIAASSVKFNLTAQGYDPYYIRVYVDGLVAATNEDTKVRTVKCASGSDARGKSISCPADFDSGPMQPGESWTYKADTLGKYSFSDPDSPFTVGTLEVLEQ